MLQRFVGNVPVQAERLFCVRDFKVHYESMDLTLEGGLLEDTTANHFYMFLLRKGPVERAWGPGSPFATLPKPARD